MSLEVINRGKRPVVVNAPQLQLPNKKCLAFVSASCLGEFPKRLDDGEIATLREGCDEIAGSLRRSGYSGTITLRPMVTDTTGKPFKGKKFKLDLDKDWWAKI